MWKLRLVARADTVVAEVESHFQLLRFKAAQVFCEVIVAITQCFTERHPIGGGFGRSSGGVRAQHKRSFAHQYDAAKNHLRHDGVADKLCEWFFGRLQKCPELWREQSARDVHLLLPVLWTNHSQWNGWSSYNHPAPVM
jgi:hypothetical protein